MTYFREIKDEEIKTVENQNFLKGYRFCIEMLEGMQFEPHASVGGVWDVTELSGIQKLLQEITSDTVVECVEYLKKKENMLKISMVEEEM